MIGFIKGSVELLKEDSLIIENNGIGYKVFVSQKTLAYVSSNSENIKIFTHTNVKEDDISLFGFLSQEELGVFEKLITVSGVGPKSALSLLSSVSPEKLITAIITSDINVLSSGQGIGKKIAQRIALELKDKMDISLALGVHKEVLINIDENENISEATEALIGLGFSKQEILKAINTLEDKNISTDKIIGFCLKKLSN